MNDFLERMKNLVDKGLDVSQQALIKAGSKIQELGDKGITKIEINRLESQTQKCFMRLGLLVYDLLVVRQKTSVSAKNEEVAAILGEIDHLKAEVENRTKDSANT